MTIARKLEFLTNSIVVYILVPSGGVMFSILILLEKPKQVHSKL